MPTPRTLHAVGRATAPRPGAARPATARPATARPAPPAPEPLLRRALGDLLRRERQRQGLSLRQLAAASRVSLAFLSEVERGRKEPSSEVLAAICRALRVTLVDLVGALHAELGGSALVLTSSGGAAGAARPAASTAPGGVQLAA